MAAKPLPRRPSSLRLFAVALSALAIAAAGCGGESKQESYRKEFQGVNRSLVQLGLAVRQGFQTAPGKSNGRLRREFGDFADRLHKIRGDLDGLDPPSRLASEQGAVLRAMARVEGGLRGIERAAAKGNFNAARRATVRFFVASASLKRARQRLNRDVRKG